MEENLHKLQFMIVACGILRALRGGGEVHLIGNVGKRQRFVVQQTSQFIAGKLLYPVGSWLLTHFTAYFREILWHDAQFVGIESHFAIFLAMLLNKKEEAQEYA